MRCAMWRDGQPDEFDESDRLRKDEGHGYLTGLDAWLDEHRDEYDFWDDPDPDEDDEDDEDGDDE
jgi:hypothetical protein